MQQEDKAMVMTLYMTIVKQHSQHIMTPTITIYMIVVKQLTLTTKHKTVQSITVDLSIAELKYMLTGPKHNYQSRTFKA
jgi:hypothetical protein